MYSLYLCVHCFSVYRYIYLGVCSFCAVATLRRGALLFLCNLCNPYSMFLIKSLYSCFCRTFCPFALCLSCVPSLRSLRTFCRTFCPQTFSTFILCGFRAVLSGLIVWRVHLHRLHRLSRLYSLICGKIAVFRGV